MTELQFVKDVKHLSVYKLALTFEDGSVRRVDLQTHLDGEIFVPLKEIDYFKTVRVNPELDTIVWDNGADMAPEFLYENSVPMMESVKAK